MVRPKVVLGVVALLISAGALTVISPRSGEAQGNGNGNGGAPAPVIVTNTPLPVTGDVNATISGNVNLQPGTVVNIGNSATAPVLVREVGAMKQPTFGSGGCFFANGLCTVNIGTVPAGYRLVIEQFSGSIHLNEPERVAYILVGKAFLDCCISPTAGYLVPHIVPGTAWFNVSDQTLMFFESGDTIRIFVQKATTDGLPGTSNFTYAGYLIAN